MRWIIQPKMALAIEIEKGQIVQIVDTEGKQVADFVAYNFDNPLEKLSTKATIDNNNSIFLFEGQTIFSNKYYPLLTLTKSSVPHHDLIFPACSQSMYENQYQLFNHPNCLQNLQFVLNATVIPDPINFFMNTSVRKNGAIQVNEPSTNAGDYVELKAEKNLIAAITACSVSESNCNGFKCTGLEVRIL